MQIETNFRKRGACFSNRDCRRWCSCENRRCTCSARVSRASHLSFNRCTSSSINCGLNNTLYRALKTGSKQWHMYKIFLGVHIFYQVLLKNHIMILSWKKNSSVHSRIASNKFGLWTFGPRRIWFIWDPDWLSVPL